MSWPLVPLGDLCALEIGKTPSRAETDFWRDGIHPWLSIADMNQGRDLQITKERVTDLGVKSANMRLVPPGTLLLSYKLSIGKVGFARVPMYTNEAIAALSELSNDAYPNYVYWTLQHIDLLQGADRAAMGATLNKAKLKQVLIPLPPLPEQRRIAAILDKADALRAKRRAAIDKLDQLLKSVFLDMFGDPLTNPYGFDVCTLEEISDKSDRINYGVVQPGGEFSNGIPLVRVGDIEGGRLDASSIKHIDPEIESAYTRSRLRGNELLISCVGSIGTVAIVPDSAIGFNIARAITRIPLKHPESRAFVKACLQTVATQSYFMEKTRTVSQPTLNVEFVKQTPVLSPPTELQQRFSSIASALELQKRQMQVSATQLDTLFASLQHRAFSGEL